MKLKILSKENTAKGDITLPAQFSEPVREDLIQRAVEVIRSNNRQPYGGYGDAGMRHSADLSRRRKKYRGSYGFGISRVPRKILSRRGTRMSWVGAIVAGTVGGRRAHPPKPYKDWSKKINKKENRKAIRSALAATMMPEVISHRGHKIPDSFPFIMDDDFATIAKTKDLKNTLETLGFQNELARADVRKIRAGKGTMRGRKYKVPTSFLFVTASEDVPLFNAVSNLPGAEAVSVDNLNALLLAPGTHPGRLTLFTQGAIDRLEKEGLFTQSYKGPATKQAAAKPAKPAKKTTSKKTDTKKSAKKSSIKKKSGKKAASKKSSKKPKKSAKKSSSKKSAKKKSTGSKK